MKLDTTKLSEVKKIYVEKICGNYEICKKCSGKINLDINSMGRETDNFSTCAVFTCKKLKESKRAEE